jgi:hypothetical protein
MTKPGFDLKLDTNTLKELGIILDFWTKEIALIDISLPMRDIKKLQTRATKERTGTLNNSIYQRMSKESQSMLEATQCHIQILDAKYEKADLRAIVNVNFNKHFGAPEKASLLELLQEFEELFDGTLGDWIVIQFCLK